MDFYKILQKFNEIDPVKTENKPVAAEPTVAKKIALAEDAQMRVLAGVSTILEEGRRISDRQEVAEAKKKNEYAIGMAAAKKQAGMGDEPATGLPKKVIKKGHEIAKAIKRDESVEEAASWIDPLKAAQGAMSSVKKDSESERNRHKPYGSRSDSNSADEDDDDKPAKKKTKEKTKESFRSKFEAMVEAKKEDKKVKGKKAEEKMDEASKPDFLDIDKDGDKKEPMKKAAAEKGGDKKDGKKGMSDKQAKYFGKKKSVKESFFEDDQEGPEDLLAAIDEEMNNPGKTIDNLQDVLNGTFDSMDSPKFKRPRAMVEKYLELVTNADIDHYDDEEDPNHEDEPMIRRMQHGNIARHIKEYDLGDYLAAAYSEIDKIVNKSMGESYKPKNKKTIKESVIKKYTFKQCLQMVKESGGQQQIDPIDTALWKWAQRVAESKVQEGASREAMAAFVYERMGGEFTLYDVLSETK